jgi:hypothetical protein
MQGKMPSIISVEIYRLEYAHPEKGASYNSVNKVDLSYLWPAGAARFGEVGGCTRCMCIPLGL